MSEVPQIPWDTSLHVWSFFWREVPLKSFQKFWIPWAFTSWKTTDTKHEVMVNFSKVDFHSWDYFCSFKTTLWFQFLIAVDPVSNASTTLSFPSDQSNASVDEIEIYWCCGYAPYLSVFPVSTHAHYRCRSEIPITACVSVINNSVDSSERRQGGNGGSASMFRTRSAIHTRSALTWASGILPRRRCNGSTEGYDFKGSVCSNQTKYQLFP